MKRTPLYEIHGALGATFTESYEDWELVGHFTDPTEEHRTVRQGVGIVDLLHRGRLRLTGSDRAAYLHRIISNDVEGLAVGEGNYATILTNRGKIIADMNVYVFGESIGIETNAETTIESLSGTGQIPDCRRCNHRRLYGKHRRCRGPRAKIR